MSGTKETAALIDVTAPGSLPFVDFAITDFTELVAATQQLQASNHWAVRTPAGPLVIGYEQTREILRDPAWITVLSGVGALQAEGQNEIDFEALVNRARDLLPGAGDQVEMRPNLLSVEGDDHRRLRRLVSSSFTPASSESLRPFMREHADQLLKPIVQRGEGDLVAEFCRPYPIPVICRLLGIDDDDHERFGRWADIIFSGLDADAEAVIGRLEQITSAQRELDQYATGLVAERKGCPHADLVSDLVQASYEEDRLSPDELVAMIEAILLAGTDTTRNQLGSLLAVLATQPEQYQRLRADRSLVPAAIEESLRYIGAVRTTARVASEDLIVDGLFFPSGTTVLLGLHAAGLGQPEDGFRFDLDRADRAPHLAFGLGAHHCLGAALARAELQEALNSFLDAIPAYQLAAPVSWKPLSMGIWGPDELQFRILADSTGDNEIETLTDVETETTTLEVGLPAPDSENQWIRDAHAVRRVIVAGVPRLVNAPSFPPAIRLTHTTFRFGWALLSWKLFDRRLSGEERTKSLYRRLRIAAERLGPTYVKLAQLISAAEGVFPQALVDECSRCRDQAKPSKWLGIKRILTKDLGSLSDSFELFEKQPFAAASIAQVHRAVLKDGSEVVVKIQRPAIHKKVVRDLRVLAWIAPRLVGRIPVSALANPPALVQLFAETISEELDFRLEVANLFEIRRALGAGGERGRWLAPDPNLDLTTTRVIVMSRVPGIPLTRLDSEELNEEAARNLFRNMVDGLLEGAALHGIFHGDFHAGNLFIGEQGAIGLVDYGMVGRLDHERRISFLRYVTGLMSGDVRTQVSAVRDLGAFPPDADIEDLIQKLQLERVDFDPLQLTEEQFVSEFQTLLKELLASGARIPKELMLFVKNFAYLASFIQKMDPEMDLLGEFSAISAGFLTKHGFRVSAELGLAVQDLEVSESSFRRAAGIRDDVEVLTWRDLSNRREEMKDRLMSGEAGSRVVTPKGSQE
ncbi:MAG: cytochrome P450 [Acidimicrobiales bacterium]|nr:cytochrome P450 [Acidimicrobiales bacterium]